MASIVFEVSLFAEALRKARRASAKPSDKETFNKAAGVVLDQVDTERQEVRLRSTDLEVFFTQWIAYEDFEGDEENFHLILPADASAKVVSSIRSPAKKKVTLTTQRGVVVFSCARMRAELRTIRNPNFPSWEPFPVDELQECEGLAEAVSAVSWARLKAGGEPAHWTGVFADGQQIFATNRFALASIPFTFPVKEPISIPPDVVAVMLRDVGEVMVGVQDSFLCIQPDNWSQLKTILYAGNPPRAQRLMRDDYQFSVTVTKQTLVSALQAFAELGLKTESPAVELRTNGTELVMHMKETDQSLTDVVATETGDEHPETVMGFDLSLLSELVNKTPGSTITLHYDEQAERGKPRIKTSGPHGYKAWLAEMRLPERSS